MTTNAPLQHKLPQIAVKILSAYVYWNNIANHIPKMRRYSLGIKIDSVLSDLVELVSSAQFSPASEKTPLLSKAIVKNDVLKFLLYALRELNGIEIKHFLELSEKMEEIGRMLYGWKNQSLKQIEKNCPDV